MFIELHEKNTNYPMLVNVSAINTVTEENRGRMAFPSITTVLTIGNERYEVVESYVKIFRMVMGYNHYTEEGINNGGDSAE